jgi:hypothetical protein
MDGVEQVGGPERLSQEGETSGTSVGRAAGDHQAPAGRGRVRRPQLFDQVDAVLRPQMGIDQDRGVPGWVQAARFRERGGDIDLVSVGAEHAPDQGPHLGHVVDDQNSFGHLIPATSSGPADLPLGGPHTRTYLTNSSSIVAESNITGRRPWMRRPWPSPITSGAWKGATG